MNIFILDTDPRIAARMQCDKHIPKMVVETAQMLSTAVNMLGGQAQYKSAYVNHPCTVWARTSLDNFAWLSKHGFELGLEYNLRYGKIHKSSAVIMDCVWQVSKLKFDKKGLTPHPQCMPDMYKSDNPVTAYRAYYRGEKSYFAKWDRDRDAPLWWNAA